MVGKESEDKMGGKKKIKGKGNLSMILILDQGDRSPCQSTASWEERRLEGNWPL